LTKISKFQFLFSCIFNKNGNWRRPRDIVA